MKPEMEEAVGPGRLPNLLVAGVPKAGTGSLFAYLTQHPDICGADEKEVGYFNFYNPGRHVGEPPAVETYMAHFAHCGNTRYAVEASPTYSYGGQPVIDAVQRVLDRPKIIISLRDPADRLWSAYTFQRSLGNITHLPSFDAYLRACEMRRRDGSDLAARDHLHGLYIGFYGDYIGSWLDAFGDDLRVIFAEELARDPQRVVADLFRWLEIDPEAAAALDLAPRNTTRRARSPRVAQLVHSLKRWIDRARPAPAGARRASRGRQIVRRAYEVVNAADRNETMDPHARRRVEDIYRSSNETTSRALTAHGYRDLPVWLARGAV